MRPALRGELADMGAAMRRWMEVQEAMANCTLPQRGARSEQLTQARNELRDAYLRTKLFRANQATRNASVATEEQIVSRVHAQRGAHQAAAEVLRELARFEEGTPLVSGPPDFLGGRCGVAQCNDCGCERPTLLSDDCRVHDVLQSELRATMGDPIKALQSRLFDESQVRGVDNCSCGSSSWRPKSWYIASCATADGPPLVALEVGGLQVDAVRLDAVRRDASVMVTPFGNVTYALVALVYSNGGHFITVGRSASGCRNGPSPVGMCLVHPHGGVGMACGVGGGERASRSIRRHYTAPRSCARDHIVGSTTSHISSSTAAHNRRMDRVGADGVPVT